MRKKLPLPSAASSASTAAPRRCGPAPRWRPPRRCHPRARVSRRQQRHRARGCGAGPAPARRRRRRRGWGPPPSADDGPRPRPPWRPRAPPPPRRCRASLSRAVAEHLAQRRHRRRAHARQRGDDGAAHRPARRRPARRAARAGRRRPGARAASTSSTRARSSAERDRDAARTVMLIDAPPAPGVPAPPQRPSAQHRSGAPALDLLALKLRELPQPRPPPRCTSSAVMAVARACCAVVAAISRERPRMSSTDGPAARSPWPAPPRPGPRRHARGLPRRRTAASAASGLGLLVQRARRLPRHAAHLLAARAVSVESAWLCSSVARVTSCASLAT